MVLADGRVKFGRAIVSRQWGGNALASRPLAVTVALLVFARFLLAASTELAPDEAYYWLWSRHPDIGYYDHPPMIAYWIGAGTALFGDTAFGVRFAGLMSALAGSYLLYRASLCLFKDASAALLCVIWLNATLLCNAAALVATPDTPLAFFATAALYSLAKLIETGRGAWWVATGAALGAAFASKYTAALLLPGLLAWMVALPQTRRWLLRPEPYFGAAAAALFVAPVVFWNASHGWASFAKQAAHGIKDKPENALLSILELIGGQAGLASPIVFGFCLFGAGFCLVRGYRRSDQRLLLLGATTVPVFAFFLIHAASQKIQPNWPGFVYPAALLAAVHGFLALGEERRAPRPWRLAFSCAPWLGVAFTLAAFLQLGFGLFPLPEKKDPTARLKGWSTLASEVAKVQREAGARFVLTEGYAITGELAFYSPSPENVMQINERIRYAFLPEPDEAALRGAAAVLVVHQGSGPAQAALSYAEVRLAGTVARGAANRAKDKDNYDVYVMTGYRGGLFADDGTRQGG